MDNQKPVLAIVTQSLRRDNAKPLRYFSRLKIIHLYQEAPYGHETKDDFLNAKKFDNFTDLRKKLIAIKPDIIQGPEPYGSKKMFLFSIATYPAAKKLNVPLVFPFWENRPPEKRFNIIQRIIVNAFSKIYIRYCSKVIYINEGAMQNITNLGFKKTKKFVNLLWGTWGIDPDEFKPIQNPLKFDKKQIIYVGRLVPEKGIRYLLDAFIIVKKRIPKAQLLIIGDGELKSYVNTFRATHNLADDIILKGAIANKLLPKYYQNATIFCSPAYTTDKWAEQVGMTNIQSMACGTPIVSTNSGAIAEYVPNKITGLLVPEKDTRRLASAIISLMDNKKLFNQISKQCIEYALDHYDAKKNVSYAEEILLHILNHEKSQQS